MKYRYTNWNVISNGDILRVECILEGAVYAREYFISGKIKNIEIREEYVWIYLEDAYYQVKIENESELVIDKYDDNDEFLDSFGCHDFYDDVVDI